MGSSKHNMNNIGNTKAAIIIPNTHRLLLTILCLREYIFRTL